MRTKGKRAPQLISGRRIAGRQVGRVVIVYTSDTHMRGMYEPSTATLTIYRGKDAGNRILLMI